MKKKLMFLLILLLAACSSGRGNNINAIPDLDIGIPTTKNGEILEASTPEGWNSYTIGKPVSVMLYNVSSNKVILPNNYGIKIFTLYEGDWVEVNNQIVYVNTEDVVLDPLNLQEAMLLPELSNTENAYLRIFIVGKFAKDNNDTYEQFSTYIDVELHP